MGAYLHLRGLTEDNDTLDCSSNGERFHYLNEPGAGAVEMASTSTAGPVPPTGSREEDNYAVTNEMDECSTFWAGQLDDVFEELHVRAGYRDAPRGSRGLNSSEREAGLRIPREQRLDNKDNGVSSSGKSGSIRYACIENKSVGDVSFMSCGGICNATTIDAGLVGDKGSPLTSEYTLGGMEDLGSTHIEKGSCETLEDETERLPDHLLIELLVRVPTHDWPAAACVKKRWAQLFKGDGLWQSALMKKWPAATSTKRWPGPIARGSSKRRYTALYISDALFAKDKVEGVNEVAGHVYLFLKEQLESSTPPVSYGLLHGTIIDQFLACCKTGDEAHDLASHIWIAVLDNLDETENTFHLLMRIAEEWEIFLPYPYSKSKAVQWRLFERLFTDFRDCLSQYNYFDVLTRARNKFELIPQTWLGY